MPFFGWFVGFQAWLAARSALKDLAARVVARLEGRDPPPKPRRWPVVPPVPFTTEQAARLAALAFVAMVANFCGGLLTQNGDAVSDTFHQNDSALGFALAIARIGVLVSLVVIALADRLGRRKLILFALAGACVANLVAGLAPSFEVFTGAQLFTRAFVNTCLVVAGIAAVEEAPEGARAFATAMFALALGVGIALGGRSSCRSPTWATTAGGSRSSSARARSSSSRSSAGSCSETRRYTSARRPVRAARSPARGVHVVVSRPVHPARPRGVRHERVHRAVVTAHQPLSHPRARLLQLRRRGLPHRHRRACPV